MSSKRYHLRCVCGATCIVGGEEEEDTNSTTYDLDDAEWETPNDAFDGDDCHDCDHEDFECVDVDYSNGEDE